VRGDDPIGNEVAGCLEGADGLSGLGFEYAARTDAQEILQLDDQRPAVAELELGPGRFSRSRDCAGQVIGPWRRVVITGSTRAIAPSASSATGSPPCAKGSPDGDTVLLKISPLKSRT
jgi:hypothetical protein